MSLTFTVLASGSGGNASLIQANGFGLLLDAGLGPRLLASRLRSLGSSWRSIHAVLLTHTHADHWQETSLAYLARLGIPFYCHPDHRTALSHSSEAFAELAALNLVRLYESSGELMLAPGLRCWPLPLRHDGGATFGFRFHGPPAFDGQEPALGYVADLGSWTGELAKSLADVDLLALEFNHDVDMERGSGRSPYLIARVLGDEGHLSNAQAAGILGEVVARSEKRFLRFLMQLHLSRDCNHPELAREAARAALAARADCTEIHTASQFEPSQTLVLGTGPVDSPVQGIRVEKRRPVERAHTQRPMQPWLPGFVD